MNMEYMIDRELLFGSNNQPRTKSLFWEFRSMRPHLETIFTLKDHDYKGKISVHRRYVDADSEYEFAMNLFGSWGYWIRLKSTNWFSPYYERMEEERKIKEITIAKKTMLEAAENGNATAAKFILEQDKRKAGRPTKEEVESELKKQVKDSAKIHSIVERMSNI